MSAPRFIDVGKDSALRQIATLQVPGAGPEVVWLGGFRSDMRATKAETLAGWAERTGRALTRFDYSGHGESSGHFVEGSIGRWLEEAMALIEGFVKPSPILVGSSMGGWIAILAALRFMALGRAPAGLVLIAPAADFTESLMWAQFPDTVKQQILKEGQWLRPSLYAPDPYPITRHLIEEGRRHLILDKALAVGCPVHILQGMADPDVPWQHAMRLMECLTSDDVTMTLIRDGDHRLSRPQDLEKLIEAVEGISQKD